MNFSVKCVQAIAPNQVYGDLESQVYLFAFDKKQVSTPQRKARYSDKHRIRLKDAKSWALRRSGCSNTAEIKKYLNILGKKLDLRLTSAWVAIYKELAGAIKTLVLGLGDRLFEFIPFPVYLAEMVGRIETERMETERLELERVEMGRLELE